MKRIICFLLVLVICMYIPCTAFATEFVGSAGESGKPSETPGGNSGTSTGDNPKTGDTAVGAMLKWAIVMLLALVALVVIVVLRKKIFR